MSPRNRRSGNGVTREVDLTGRVRNEDKQFRSSLREKRCSGTFVNEVGSLRVLENRRERCTVNSFRGGWNVH